MESVSSETINDSLSERELQRIARMEMSVALDNYLKKKRATSIYVEPSCCSAIDSVSVCSETVPKSKSEEQTKSVESTFLQEPLRTYDEALSNSINVSETSGDGDSNGILERQLVSGNSNGILEKQLVSGNSNGITVKQLLSGEAWKRVSHDIDYRPFFGDVTSFNDPEYGIELFPGRRKPKVVISVTMYNESFKELNDSLRGIADNIENLPEYSYGLTIDDIVVFVIIDGRSSMNSTIFQYREDNKHFLTEDDAKAMNVAIEDNRRRVKAWKHHLENLRQRYTERDIIAFTKRLPMLQLHLFKCKRKISKGSIANESFYTPFDIIFAVKENNMGKLNSHLWIMRGFARQLNPAFITLLDVGTKPMPTALIQLYNEMEENPQIGGCCGEILALNASKASPVQSAQFFEYKVSHFLEKAMESSFGYVSVLPGAFSAYRYEALQGTPLDKYFLLESDENRLVVEPFSANMYLAEDRIMGFEMLVKKDCNYTLHYVNTAVATTDIPSNLNILIRQRRRWLNGSFFAGLYALKEWSRLYTESGHTLWRKILLTFQLVYQSVNLLMTLTQVANMYLTFAIVLNSEFGSDSVTSYCLNAIYLTVTVIQFIYALGNDPRDNKEIYRLSYIVYGALLMFTMFLTFYSMQAVDFFVLFAACASTFVTVVCSIIHGQFFSVIPTMIQYLFMLPTFMNMFIIYSFCNVHDVTWGTRDSNLINNEQAQKNMEISYKRFRSTLVVFWVAFNFIFAGAILMFNAVSVYGVILTIIIGILFGYRFVGSIAYQVIKVCKYLQKYHSKSGRRRLFKTIALDPTVKKKAMQVAEEERRVILDMSSVDMENNLVNATHLTHLKQLTVDVITRRVFELFSTWLIRPNTQSVHSSSYSVTSSYVSTQRFSDLLSHHTPSAVSTMHDSSLGISNSPSEDPEFSQISNPPVFDIEKNRVIGRIDYEKCICEMHPKFSRSQCVTQATRLFDKFAAERYVSKTVDGPCCNLFVLTYEEFVSSLNHLPGGMRPEQAGNTDLTSYIISEMKYNIPFVERIVEYDEMETVSTF